MLNDLSVSPHTVKFVNDTTILKGFAKNVVRSSCTHGQTMFDILIFVTVKHLVVGETITIVHKSNYSNSAENK